MRRCLI
ncbi:hypothetical protein EC880221_0621, partial [Escherichia coli 88.0221]